MFHAFRLYKNKTRRHAIEVRRGSSTPPATKFYGQVVMGIWIRTVPAVPCRSGYAAGIADGSAAVWIEIPMH